MKRNRKIIFKIVIITIILRFFGKVSYARYTQSDCLKGRQPVAQPIFNLKEGIPIKINTENKTGNYEFSIENFKENKVSDTGFWYTIEIALDVDLESFESNLNFKLYNEEQEIELTNLKTEPILINGNKKIEQKYRLNINYNESEVDDKEDIELDKIIEEILSDIHIKINAEQENI